MSTRSTSSRDMASSSATLPQLHQLPLSLQTAYAELMDEQIRQEIDLEKSFNMKRQGLAAAHAAEQARFWAALRDEPLPVQRQERRSAHLGLQYAAYNDHPTSPELESQLPLESVEPVEVIDLVSDDDNSDDESVQFTGEVPVEVDSSDVADLDPASPGLYPSSDVSGRSSGHSSFSSSSSSSSDDDSVQYIGQQPVNHPPSNTPDLPPTPYMDPISRAPSPTTPSSYPSSLFSGSTSPYLSPATPYMGPLSRAPTPPTPRRPPFSPLLMPVSPGFSRLAPVQRPVSPPLSSAAPGRTLSDYNIRNTLSDYNIGRTLSDYNNVRVDKRKRAVSVSSGEISDLDLDEGETESPGAKRQRRG